MSRSIRVTRKTHIRTDKSAPTHRAAGKSFFSGLLAGLGSATLVYDHNRRPRSYGKDGLRGDWQAVGDDMRSAAKKVDIAR